MAAQTKKNSNLQKKKNTADSKVAGFPLPFPPFCTPQTRTRGAFKCRQRYGVGLVGVGGFNRATADLTPVGVSHVLHANSKLHSRQVVPPLCCLPVRLLWIVGPGGLAGWRAPLLGFGFQNFLAVFILFFVFFFIFFFISAVACILEFGRTPTIIHFQPILRGSLIPCTLRNLGVLLTAVAGLMG